MATSESRDDTPMQDQTDRIVEVREQVRQKGGSSKGLNIRSGKSMEKQPRSNYAFDYTQNRAQSQNSGQSTSEYTNEADAEVRAMRVLYGDTNALRERRRKAQEKHVHELAVYNHNESMRSFRVPRASIMAYENLTRFHHMYGQGANFRHLKNIQNETNYGHGHRRAENRIRDSEQSRSGHADAYEKKRRQDTETKEKASRAETVDDDAREHTSDGRRIQEEGSSTDHKSVKKRKLEHTQTADKPHTHTQRPSGEGRDNVLEVGNQATSEPAKGKDVTGKQAAVASKDSKDSITDSGERVLGESSVASAGESSGPEKSGKDTGDTNRGVRVQTGDGAQNETDEKTGKHLHEKLVGDTVYIDLDADSSDEASAQATATKSHSDTVGAREGERERGSDGVDKFVPMSMDVPSDEGSGEDDIDADLPSHGRVPESESRREVANSEADSGVGVASVSKTTQINDIKSFSQRSRENAAEHKDSITADTTPSMSEAARRMKMSQIMMAAEEREKREAAAKSEPSEVYKDNTGTNKERAPLSATALEKQAGPKQNTETRVDDSRESDKLSTSRDTAVSSRREDTGKAVDSEERGEADANKRKLDVQEAAAVLEKRANAMRSFGKRMEDFPPYHKSHRKAFDPRESVMKKKSSVHAEEAHAAKQSQTPDTTKVGPDADGTQAQDPMTGGSAGVSNKTAPSETSANLPPVHHIHKHAPGVRVRVRIDETSDVGGTQTDEKPDEKAAAVAADTLKRPDGSFTKADIGYEDYNKISPRRSSRLRTKPRTSFVEDASEEDFEDEDVYTTTTSDSRKRSRKKSTPAPPEEKTEHTNRPRPDIFGPDLDTGFGSAKSHPDTMRKVCSLRPAQILELKAGQMKRVLTVVGQRFDGVIEKNDLRALCLKYVTVFNKWVNSCGGEEAVASILTMQQQQEQQDKSSAGQSSTNTHTHTYTHTHPEGQAQGPAQGGSYDPGFNTAGAGTYTQPTAQWNDPIELARRNSGTHGWAEQQQGRANPLYTNPNTSTYTNTWHNFQQSETEEQRREREMAAAREEVKRQNLRQQEELLRKQQAEVVLAEQRRRESLQQQRLRQTCLACGTYRPSQFNFQRQLCKFCNSIYTRERGLHIQRMMGGYLDPAAETLWRQWRIWGSFDDTDNHYGHGFEPDKIPWQERKPNWQQEYIRRHTKNTLQQQQTQSETLDQQQKAQRLEQQRLAQEKLEQQRRARLAKEQAKQRHAAAKKASDAECARWIASLSPTAVENEEARWTRFERNTIIAQIRLRDIPFPLYNPCGIICTPNNEDDMTVIKKKIRKAMLRWHPDKFINNFGSKLFGPERDEIIKEVNKVSHMVSKDKERLENTSYAGNFPWRYRYR